MRVPMLVRWPGRLPAGAVREAMGMQIDLFPTLLGLAGLPLPTDRTIDGADLLETWRSGAPSAHEHLFYFPTIGATPVAVRDARFKYRLETEELGRGKPHLSDLALDAEAHNLASLHATEAAALAAALDAMTRNVEANPRGWR
jgi:arylsulfatase A-like enzyme